MTARGKNQNEWHSDRQADTPDSGDCAGLQSSEDSDAATRPDAPDCDRNRHLDRHLTVAALYVDPRGPYPKMAGVECWDAERDARLYGGPHPVVAHPPCGPWGKLAHMCTKQDRTLALLDGEQVRRWGGVLEHPEWSRLWRECRLPYPGELPDGHGGWTLAVRQCDWGHRCAKPTWLYIVGALAPPLPEARRATAAVTNSKRPWQANVARASNVENRRTPPAFAEWLVEIVRRARVKERAA